MIIIFTTATTTPSRIKFAASTFLLLNYNFLKKKKKNLNFKYKINPSIKFILNLYLEL
jgi:hypothetical protein